MKNLLNTYRSLVLLFLFAAATQLFAEKPVIDKIDPPGWWTQLPDPMLLVHGQGLDHALEGAVEVEGEHMRPYTWCVLQEVCSGDWGIGGHTDWLRDYTSALDEVGAYKPPI